MCLEIAKSGNNVMFPNLVHSRVARNGKMCAQELPKVANLAHSRVARNGNVTVSKYGSFWSYRNGNGVCPRIPKSGYNVLLSNLALSMELPGMAKSGNVTVSKYGSFWSYQEWQWCVPKNSQKWL